MIKSGVVTSDTPSCVSGARGTVVKHGEALLEREEPAADVVAPLEKRAALLATLPGENPETTGAQ